MTQRGRGVKKDLEKAAALYQLAADNGNDDAQVNLGLLFEAGRGVKQDFVSAARMYRRALDRNAGAQVNLGVSITFTLFLLYSLFFILFLLLYIFIFYI